MAKYFLGRSEIPNSADPCQVHPLGIWDVPQPQLPITFQQLSVTTVRENGNMTTINKNNVWDCIVNRWRRCKYAAGHSFVNEWCYKWSISFEFCWYLSLWQTGKSMAVVTPAFFPVVWYPLKFFKIYSWLKKTRWHNEARVPVGLANLFEVILISLAELNSCRQ